MMDALFTLPMLSFLLIPAVSSYGTSLNLLFFYITWTTLVLSHPPLRVEVVGIAAVKLIFFLLPSLLFFVFDALLPSAAAVIKVKGQDGLPGGKRRNVGRQQIKVAAWSLFNLFLGIAIQGLFEYGLTIGLGMKSALKVSTTLPMPFGIAKDLVRGLLGREILQYLIHRYILHGSSRVAARHTSWYHSIPTPYPLTAHYDHPIPYLMSRFAPTFAPAAIFRFHLLTYLLYLAIISLEETFGYAGYKPMPMSFFIGGIARRIDLHLASKGSGNYGPWGIMDWIFGTTVQDQSGEGGKEYYSSDGTDVDELVRQILERRKKKEKAQKGQKGQKAQNGPSQQS